MEFGNTARGDSDMNKHRQAADRELIDVAITFLAMPELAEKMDDSVAHLPRVVKCLASDEAHHGKPHLVIGIPENPGLVVDVDGWGFALEELKSCKNTAAKQELAERLWSEFMRPRLPPHSCHEAHLAQVAATDIHMGLHAPTFSGFTRKAPEAPLVRLYGSDGEVILEKPLDVNFETPSERGVRGKKTSKLARKRVASAHKAAAKTSPDAVAQCSFPPSAAATARVHYLRVIARIRRESCAFATALSQPVQEARAVTELEVQAPSKPEQPVDILWDLFEKACTGDCRLDAFTLARIEGYFSQATAPPAVQAG